VITKLGKQKLEEQLLQLQTELNRTCEARGKAAEEPAPTQTDTIVFGSRIKIRFESDKRELDITLVGKNDFNLCPGWISSESPLGIALMNQPKGAKVSVNDQTVTILDISVGEI